MERPIEIEPLSEETIALDTEVIEQAMAWSRPIANPTLQWQVYLNSLALFSFEQWLNQRARDVTFDRNRCSSLENLYSAAIPAACHVVVNDFKLCLIATESQPDETIPIPRAAIELPEFVAHFYVLVEIYEEQAQAKIHRFLGYDQLVNRLTSVDVEEDWTYSVPLNWFHSGANQLLLYLRCLAPAAISLPAIPGDRRQSIAEIQSELLNSLPQLQSSSLPWWEVLSWKQGAAVLTSPEIMEWIGSPRSQTEVQQAPESEDSTPVRTQSLATLLQTLTQPIINASNWFQHQLDLAAEEFAWMLLPPRATGSALRNTSPTGTRLFSRRNEARSPSEELDLLLRQLERNGMHLPPETVGAYRDWEWANIPLRLFAITGMLAEAEPSPEWMLLLILGTQSDAKLPPGITLKVGTSTEIVVEQTLSQQSENGYLIAQVTGSLNEKFIAIITLSDGTALTLPAFAFQPIS